MDKEMLLSHRCRFSASHYYYVNDWAEAKNIQVFGKAANPNGHGHNYLLEVTVKGEVDPVTGMVMNIHDLKEIVSNITAELDHKNLNKEVLYFETHLPTPENICRYLWDKISEKLSLAELASIRAWEDEFTSAELREKVTFTNNYHFSAAHRLHTPLLSQSENENLYGKCANPKGHGHNYTVDVTVTGTPDPVTGMAVDRKCLDDAVHQMLIKPWDHRNLNEEIEELIGSVPTGENLVKLAWEKLNHALGEGMLQSVKIGETPNAFFEYRGEEA